MESDDKTYLINKKINLEPEQVITIDLSKEVPQGTYDILLPKEIVEKTSEVESEDNESVQEVVEQTNLIENVQIDDNRNLLKKTTAGVSGITGAVVGAAGYVSSRPVLAAAILALIILATVTHYSWGFIRNKVKGGKREETEHIFEDFKYEGKSNDTTVEQNEDNKPGNQES